MAGPDGGKFSRGIFSFRLDQKSPSWKVTVQCYEFCAFLWNSFRFQVYTQYFMLILLELSLLKFTADTVTLSKTTLATQSSFEAGDFVLFSKTETFWKSNSFWYREISWLIGRVGVKSLLIILGELECLYLSNLFHQTVMWKQAYKNKNQWGVLSIFQQIFWQKITTKNVVQCQKNFCQQNIWFQSRFLLLKCVLYVQLLMKFEKKNRSVTVTFLHTLRLR